MTVLGPGDRAKLHDRVNELKAERSLEQGRGAAAGARKGDKAGGSAAAGALAAPGPGDVLLSGGVKEFEVLKLRCHKAVGLPPMDWDLFGQKWGGLDLFVEAHFSNLPPHLTRTRPVLVHPPDTSQGAHVGGGHGPPRVVPFFCNAALNTELQIPVATPSVHDKVSPARKANAFCRVYLYNPDFGFFPFFYSFVSCTRIHFTW